MPQSPHIQGVSVSPGLALGPVHVTTPGIDQVPTWSVSKSEVAGEIGRLAAALTQALDALRSDEALAAERAGKQEASIFAVHRMYLQDPGALRRVEGIISDQRVNAEAAVNMVIEDLQQSLERMEGANVRSYAMLQLLLGNTGVSGGGINALRGESLAKQPRLCQLRVRARGMSAVGCRGQVFSDTPIG